MLLYSLLGVFIPFLGTSLGSFFVFFSKKKFNNTCYAIIVSFAIGVMLAACVWSLIIPSIEMSTNFGSFSWIPAVVGVIFGVLFLLFIDKYCTKLKCVFSEQKNSINMLLFSVTLHNIPEGMAIGACFAGVLSGNNEFSLLSALVLAIGIAIQNIPEGAIISLPMYLNGVDRKKAFFSGILSGVVEPVAAIFTIFLIKYVSSILPFLLSFAAGAMLYVIFEELVCEMHDGNRNEFRIVSLIFGFVIMMILDVMLG